MKGEPNTSFILDSNNIKLTPNDLLLYSVFNSRDLSLKSHIVVTATNEVTHKLTLRSYLSLLIEGIVFTTL